MCFYSNIFFRFKLDNSVSPSVPPGLVNNAGAANQSSVETSTKNGYLDVARHNRTCSNLTNLNSNPTTTTTSVVVNSQNYSGHQKFLGRHNLNYDEYNGKTLSGLEVILQQK